ncbi:MAG: PUA domain-containing protein [Thermoplasmatota archaeon]
MKDLFLKRRSRLRSKEARRIVEWIKDEWGIERYPEELESGNLEGKEAYVLDGRIIGLEEKGGFMITLKGVLELKPTKRWITVDMGAVRFLANGADVMAPGIIDADVDISIDDLVWVRDEKNGRPLCIGRALIPGADMKDSDSGKAVRTIHYVGDPIWNAHV